MPQVAIYIDDKLSTELKKVIKASGKSRSKWISDLIRARLEDNWPEDFFELAGSWEGEETPEEIIDKIRKGTRKLEEREDLS